MGYLIRYHSDGTQEIMGDKADVERAKRDLGLPYYKPDGRYVSQPELDESEEAGE